MSYPPLYNYASINGAGINEAALEGAGDFNFGEAYNDAALAGAGGFNFGRAYNDAALAGAGGFNFGRSYNDAALAGAGCGVSGGFAIPSGKPTSWLKKTEREMSNAGARLRNRVLHNLPASTEKIIKQIMGEEGKEVVNVAIYLNYVGDCIRQIILTTPKTSKVKLRNARKALVRFSERIKTLSTASQRMYHYIHELMRREPHSDGSKAHKYLVDERTRWRRTPMLRGLDFIHSYKKKSKN